MKPQRKNRLILILSLVLGLGLAATLLGFALKQNLNHFYALDEIHNGKAPLNQSIRAGGMVKIGSIERLDKLNIRFVVTDFKSTEQELTVYYDGILPDLFREGQGVVAKGQLSDRKTFVASEILAKHDEKYMAKELRKGLEETPQSTTQPANLDK